MKELHLGSKVLFAPAFMQSKVLLTSIQEFYQSLTRKMHVAFQHHKADRSLVYGLLCYDLGLPYMVKNMNTILQKFVDAPSWLRWKSLLAMRSPGAVEKEYVDFVKWQLSVTQGDEYKLIYAMMAMRGRFGEKIDVEKAKAVLQTCALKDCLVHLGYGLGWLY